MTFRLTLARVAVAALAGLLALAPSAPAAAVIPPVPVDPFLTHAPCATGAITFSSGSVRPDDNLLMLEGWIEPCTAPARPAGFGVMRYYTTLAKPSYFGTVHRIGGSPSTYPLYPYDPAAPRTQFTFDFRWESGGRLRALCLARTVEAPVACVAVELPENEFARRFLPIPVDDPRITSVPISLERRGGTDSDPACGNCV